MNRVHVLRWVSGGPSGVTGRGVGIILGRKRRFSKCIIHGSDFFSKRHRFLSPFSCTQRLRDELQLSIEAFSQFGERLLLQHREDHLFRALPLVVNRAWSLFTTRGKSKNATIEGRLTIHGAHDVDERDFLR